MLNIDIKGVLKKKSVNNGLWLYALQFFNTIIPLITIPYITRILGAEQYGVFSLALNFTSYLQVAVEYGFALSATRQVAFLKNDKDLSKLFVSVISARFILYFISLIATGCYVLLTNRSQEFYLCLVVLSVSLIGYCFQENWLFQGKQEMRFISISSIIARSITTIAIFCFVKTKKDILLYCILYSLSPVVTNMLGTIIAIIRYRITFVHLGIKDIFFTLKDGMYIFFTNLSAKVFGAIGVTILGVFGTEYQVGVYSALYKIPYILMLLWQPIAQVLYPISSKKIIDSYDDGRAFICKVRNYCLFIFGFIAILVAAFCKPLAQLLFGEEYSQYYYIILPLLIWMLLGILNNFIGIQTLVGSGHDKEYSKAFQIGVVCTVLINLVLIRLFNIIGTAFAPMLSEAVLCFLLIRQVKKVNRSIQE